MSDTPHDHERFRQKLPLSERLKGMDAIGAIVADRFRKSSVKDVFILPQRDVDYRAYVFFEGDEDVARAKQADILHQIIESIYSELCKAGRGSRNNIELDVEFDSRERVGRDFGGDYYARMS